MDIHKVKITQKDIQRVLDEAKPAAPAGVADDVCGVYKEARPLLKIAITVLGVLYPPASTAIATVIAILDQACQVQQ